MRKETAKSGLLLDVAMKETNKKTGAIIEVILMSLLYFSFAWHLLSMFRLEKVSLFAILPGFLFIILLVILSKTNQLYLPFLVIFTVLFIAVSIIQKTVVMNGLFVLLNDIRHVVGVHTGLVMKQYEITMAEGEIGYAASFFGSTFFILLAFICYGLIRSRSKFLLWLVMLIIVIFQVFTGIMPAISAQLLSVFTVVLATNYMTVPKGKDNGLTAYHNWRIVAITSTIMIAVLGSIIILLNMMIPAKDYSKHSIMHNVQIAAERKVEAIRYEKEPASSFTNGDFTQVGNLVQSDLPALEVIMDQPTSLYLKGYVGAQYTSEGWTELEKSVNLDAYDLFYWLDQSNFSSLNQLQSVARLHGDENVENVQIAIQNLNANRKYLYIPYELATPVSQMNDVEQVQDYKVQSTKFFGEDFYKYEATTNLVQKYPTLANDVYTLKKQGEQQDYFNGESHYNAFVYEHYTQLPKESASIISHHIQGGSEERISYEQAIEQVTTYLEDNMNYTINVEQMSPEDDFLRHFLEKSQNGYATHFATAATAMFRYLQIPARYVEGYLIRPTDVEGKEAFEKMILTGENAHAWTEIYLDGVGWIPIEVTPPYKDMMGKIDLSNYPESLDLDGKAEAPKSSEDLMSEGKQEVVDEENQPTSSQKKPEEPTTLFEKALILLYVLLGVALLIYIVYLIKRRRKVRKLYASFEGADYKMVIPKLFYYAMDLLHYDGITQKAGSTYHYVEEVEQRYSDKYAEQFKSALKIQQAALYSPNGMTEMEYDEMQQFMNDTLTQVLASKNIFQRLKMKFVAFVY